jgi:hypothetical protein
MVPWWVGEEPPPPTVLTEFSSLQPQRFTFLPALSFWIAMSSLFVENAINVMVRLSHGRHLQDSLSTLVLSSISREPRDNMPQNGKMRKNAHTDSVLQDILKNNAELMQELEDIAVEIGTIADQNFEAKGHPVNIMVGPAPGPIRTKIRITAVSADENKDVRYVEAKYGAMAKALRSVQKAKKKAAKEAGEAS